ncbi:hypothetical protein BCV69DRAFT_279249 [Microstroma glucosiphilum]|uniref:Uncharacterized protein n=1 Tax=Pseudomicrostroma glucosiphilum TaxID=1684307 RepID=A0A316U0I1_9BASI|nr:hypothetical protein BCV69DRAFT_279249 [Pseudomicrostroma glucosiphilum]PWN18003.1 hypothetical protein BCV69DRAFT_279249 [Pseudomicrostroma glucosiphilum]
MKFSLPGVTTALLCGLSSWQSVNATPLPLSDRGLEVKPTTSPETRAEIKRSLHNLGKRSVTATEVCRKATNDDLRVLTDAQLRVLMDNANSLFNFPVTSFATPRTYRSDMFYGTSYGGWNARLSVLRNVDIVQYDQNPAQVCLDGLNAEVNFYPDEGTCSKNSISTYGRSMSDGTQISLSVTQGYTVSTTVTTESSTGQSFQYDSTTEKTVSTSSSSGSSSEVNGNVETTLGFELFGAESSVGISVGFNSVDTSDSSSGTDTTTGGTTSTGSDSSSTSGTEVLAQQDFSNSVAITISPPAGYTCYVSVDVTQCRGSASVVTDIVYPSGMVLFDFGANPACLASDSQCSQGTSRYFYVPIDTLLNGFTPSVITDYLSIGVKMSGQYSEHCDAPKVVSSSNDTTTAVSSVDKTYKPTLNCPTNLGIKKGCSATMDDYLGESVITGDTNLWASNSVSYSQSPGPSTNVSFGQQMITFNASTPYQSTSCQALLQVVPEYSSTFVPSVNQLPYPQDGSDVLDASYVVGYVSSCDETQYGTCVVKSVSSRSTKGFTWQQTSPKGNPQTTFRFGNSGNGWPEDDVLTFSISCSDVYGNTGGLQSFQQAYRNDIATSTLTAATSTYTFHSATKFLYSSISTLYTSMVTPIATVDLNTRTFYLTTTYTGTRIVPGPTAASFYGGVTTTRVESTTSSLLTGVKTEFVTQATPTVFRTITRPAKNIVTQWTTLPQNSTTQVTLPTITTTTTATQCGTIVEAASTASPTSTATVLGNGALGGRVTTTKSSSTGKSNSSAKSSSTKATSSSKSSSTSSKKASSTTSSKKSTSTKKASSTTKKAKSTSKKDKRSVETAVGLADRAVHSVTTVTDKSGTYVVTDYTGTATQTLSATTVVTDFTAWATSTVAKTSTVYDPFQTLYVFATLTTDKIKTARDSYTQYDTVTSTRMVTDVSTVYSVTTSTIPQVTRPTVSYLPDPTVTSTATPSTYTALTAFSTSTSTITETVSKEACTLYIL